MDSKEIGHFIYELRTEKGLSQYQLADMIPISRQAVSKWERGITIPDSATLLILSKIFDVSINELLIGRKFTNQDSKTEIQDTITLNAIDDVSKKSITIKKLKIIIISFFLLFINIFLIYYFVNSYNSIKVFTIEGESKNFKTVDGIFVITKGKVYFRLGDIKYDEDINIDNFELYNIYNNEKQVIFSTDSPNILLRDYYGYEAYFEFGKLNQIINNLYLRVYFNNNYEDIHLNLKKDFSNNNFLFFQDAKESYKNNDSVIPTFELREDASKILNKLDCDDDICTLEFKEDERSIIYTYIKYNHLLNISDSSESKVIEWNYLMNEKLIYYNHYENGKEIESVEIDLDKINVSDENYKYIKQIQDNYIIKHLY